MSIMKDVEKIDEKYSDDDLVRLIRQKPSEETILASLRELSRRKSPRRLEIFQEIIADSQQSVRTKRNVITELGTERIPQNQELLLQQLPVADAKLFPMIVRSLGKIGDEGALIQLEDIKAPDDAISMRSLAFTRSLMAYRLRLDRHLIKMPSATLLVKLRDGIPFETAKAKAGIVRLASEHVKKDLPAIPLAQRGAVRLTCRKNELLLVFTNDFKWARALRTIGQRSALPLVLLKKNLSLDRYILQQYFFTQPSKDSREIALLGVRPRGDLTYTGKILITRNGFIFSLGSVKTRYAPEIEVEGRYNPGRQIWQFSKAMTSVNVAAREDRALTPRKVSPTSP